MGYEGEIGNRKCEVLGRAQVSDRAKFALCTVFIATKQSLMGSVTTDHML